MNERMNEWINEWLVKDVAYLKLTCEDWLQLIISINSSTSCFSIFTPSFCHKSFCDHHRQSVLCHRPPLYLLLKLYSKYKIDRNITHDTDINIKEKKLKNLKKRKSMHMQNTVHETQILKMSFISSRVNDTGSIRKLSLTIIISQSRSATATWWLYYCRTVQGAHCIERTTVSQMGGSKDTILGAMPLKSRHQRGQMANKTGG